MLTSKIDLYKYFNIARPKNATGYLTTYIHSQDKSFYSNRIRPAMLVIAGGGYEFVSDREDEPVANRYYVEGFNCFSLEYSVKPVSYPYQLIEGCMAVAYIRKNAKELGVDVNHVSAVGFSAGGHLAGMLATMTDEVEVKNMLKDAQHLCKPNAVILSYPVISSSEIRHFGSIENLSGGDEEIKQKISLENRVDKNSAPAFIWATYNDDCVPSENSLLMALSYKKYNVPFELHIFREGVHGLSLCDSECARTFDMEYMYNENARKWFELSVKFLRDLGFKAQDIR